MANVSSTWVSTEVTREVNYIQDYLISLAEFLRNIDEKYYPEIGRIIRNDFITLSSNLEKLSFSYFSNELMKQKLNDLSKHHKYPIETTNKRFSESDFSTHYEDIRSLIEGKR